MSAGTESLRAGRPSDPNVCANCGHSRALHFDPNAYVPGKCNYQYDLCSCRDFQPEGAESE